MRKRLLTRILAAALSASMVVGLCPTTAFPVLASETNMVNTGENKETGTYVLMNIPYEAFYKAEVDGKVDAVTTATVKTYNTGKAAGTYHEGYKTESAVDAKILGLTYPVLVEDMSVLDKYTKVTDEDSATITVASGKSGLTTKDVTGKDLLFASGDYAYYVLSETPNAYKTLTVEKDGTFTFGKITGIDADTTKTATASVSYTGNYTKVTVTLEAEEVTGTTVNAVIVKTTEGNEYVLQQVIHIWDQVELGWNWDELDGAGLAGKTIDTITYYVMDTEGTYHAYEYKINTAIKLNPNGDTEATGTVEDDANTITVTGIPADIENPKATVKTSVGRKETATVIAEDVAVEDGKITTTNKAAIGTYVVTITSDNYADIKFNVTKENGYVLMNIPYSSFYNGEGNFEVDAVTTATVKTYNTGKAAGTYHEGYVTESAENAKILGLTYPVYVSDVTMLDNCTKVTEHSAATITVASGKSSLTTKDVTGKDVLFASGDYAYYPLSEEPNAYKTLTVEKNGTFTFGKITGVDVDTTKTATTSVSYTGNYTKVTVTLEAEEVTGTTVNAVIVKTTEGNEYVLQQVIHIWDQVELGWNWDELDGSGLAGKTIDTITYYVMDSEGTYHAYEYKINTAIKLNPGSTSSATFTDGKNITVTGMPSDIKNPKATVKTKVGRGETATVIASNVAVTNGKIVTTSEAETNTYVITITSDNYGDIVVNADYTKPNTPAVDEGNNDNGNNNGNDTNNNQTPQVAAPKKVKLSKTSVTYTGKAIKPTVTVTDANGKTIAKANNYTVSYKNNKAVGKATVTVTFKGDYASYGKKTATFKIVPKNTSVKKLTKGKKQIKVTWKAQKTQTTGYQIQYSTSKKFTAKTTKTITVTKNKTTSKTIKSLKAKKTYYVRIRTYKTVGKTKYVSAWSKAKTVKTK